MYENESVAILENVWDNFVDLTISGSFLPASPYSPKPYVYTSLSKYNPE